MFLTLFSLFDYIIIRLQKSIFDNDRFYFSYYVLHTKMFSREAWKTIRFVLEGTER